MHIVSQYCGITMFFVDTIITVITWYFLFIYLMLYKGGNYMPMVSNNYGLTH